MQFEPFFSLSVRALTLLSFLVGGSWLYQWHYINPQLLYYRYIRMNLKLTKQLFTLWNSGLSKRVSCNFFVPYIKLKSLKHKCFLFKHNFSLLIMVVLRLEETLVQRAVKTSGIDYREPVMNLLCNKNPFTLLWHDIISTRTV